jgi:hypothetical protein
LCGLVVACCQRQSGENDRESECAMDALHQVTSQKN